MRRKARLKVLYWPILASTCIILILFASGPYSRFLRPVIARVWAGGDLNGPAARWFPGAYFGTQTEPTSWIQMASDSRHKRSLTPPRTLVKQGGQPSPAAGSRSLDARENFEVASQPRSIHSPHALRMEAANAFSQLAQARLIAPKRDDAEELAGMETGRGAKSLLVSQRELTSGETTTSASSSIAAHVGDELRDSTKRPADATHRARGIGAFPETPELLRDLNSVVRVAKSKNVTRFASTKDSSFSIEVWQAEIATLLSELSSLPAVTSPEAGAILEHLRFLAAEGHEAGESIEDREIQIRMLRAVHGLDRRLAIWAAVWRTNQSTVSRVTDHGLDEDLTSGGIAEIERFLTALRSEVQTTEDPEGWARFLMLEELTEINLGDDVDARRIAAQRFLSRLTWHRLSEVHDAWLDRGTVRNLAISLRRWAATPLDYAALMAQIERQESDAIDLGAIDVAAAVQSLRFAESREANRIADSLNTHYRNANIRIAVTSELISRMIPEVDAKVQPVRDNILGADVRGTSVASSDLRLRLVPSPNTWKMVLENNGRVETGASSRQWPVVIRSDSDASFISSTPLEISPSGAVAGTTSVDIRSTTRIRGVKTEFDSIPVLNSLVRELAMNRYDSMAPLASRIQKDKIRSGVTSEVDTKVNEQIDAAAVSMSERLLGPLASLRLSPLIVDMQTSESRLSARYRVAGDWQLAAFTPRPRAPQTSLMSVQVHQSAMNNTLETLLPSGEAKTVNDVIHDIRGLFGIQTPIAIGEDDELAGDIAIQFASTRPITIEIEDDILWVTMRVVRLSQSRGLDLRRFIVRAGYRPIVEGMSAKLVREGHLRISGPDMSMRDRLPVRAIFNKVFSPRRALPIVPDSLAEQPTMAGLCVTQAELRDGWIAVAIGRASDAVVVPQVARAEEDADGSSSF